MLCLQGAQHSNMPLQNVTSSKEKKKKKERERKNVLFLLHQAKQTDPFSGSLQTQAI